MKKICKTIMCLLFVFTMAGTMIIPMSANAATNVTRTSGRKSYQTLYAVPEGGWSTISFEAELVEKYNYSTNEVAYSVNTKNYAMLSSIRHVMVDCMQVEQKDPIIIV